jgi:hypothetical protein
MIVVPTPFGTKGAEMFQHAKSLLEDPDGLVAIDRNRFSTHYFIKNCSSQ